MFDMNYYYDSDLECKINSYLRTFLKARIVLPLKMKGLRPGAETFHHLSCYHFVYELGTDQHTAYWCYTKICDPST